MAKVNEKESFSAVTSVRSEHQKFRHWLSSALLMGRSSQTGTLTSTDGGEIGSLILAETLRLQNHRQKLDKALHLPSEIPPPQNKYFANEWRIFLTHVACRSEGGEIVDTPFSKSN